MITTTLNRLAVLSALAAVAAACAESPTASRANLAVLDAPRASMQVDLGPCANLAVPAGHEVSRRVYATGVQIYRWNGASWAPVGPEATLHADKEFRSLVGTHYRGPTWESLSGSLVEAMVDDRCTPDAGSIQWLRLKATRSTGPGIFDGTTYVQRLRTAAGVAPGTPGALDQVARIPYTAEYVFYRLADE